MLSWVHSSTDSAVSFYCMQHIPARFSIASISTFYNPSHSIDCKNIHLPENIPCAFESRSDLQDWARFICCVQQFFSELFSCTSDGSRLSVSFSDFWITVTNLSSDALRTSLHVLTSVIDSVKMIVVVTFATRLATTVAQPVPVLSLTNALHATSSCNAFCVRHEYWYNFNQSIDWCLFCDSAPLRRDPPMPLLAVSPRVPLHWVDLTSGFCMTRWSSSSSGPSNSTSTLSLNSHNLSFTFALVRVKSFSRVAT